ncbi:hypothetical protein GQR58_021162 [Nymphon striatum]|nr:hypothetical protein GQR58_021162 [Nymphon striatum]
MLLGRDATNGSKASGDDPLLDYWDTPEELGKWLTEVVGEYRPDLNNTHSQSTISGDRIGSDDGDLGRGGEDVSVTSAYMSSDMSTPSMGLSPKVRKEATPHSNASFVYNDGVNEQTNGSTGTTYDQLAATMPSEMVKIPAGWYAIIWLTSGVNQLVKVILPTGADIRGLMYQQQQMSIDDPEYPTSQMNAQFVALQAATSEEDAYKVAPTYPGNLFYMDYLYNNNVCSAADVSGLDSLCIPKTGGILSPQNAGYGQTSCATWWDSSLKDKVANDFAGNNLSIAGGTWATVFSTDNTVNRLIFGKLGQSNANVSESGLGDSNGGDWGWGWFKEKVAAVAVAIGGFFMQFPTTFLKRRLLKLTQITLTYDELLQALTPNDAEAIELYSPQKILIQMTVLAKQDFMKSKHTVSFRDDQKQSSLPSLPQVPMSLVNGSLCTDTTLDPIEATPLPSKPQELSYEIRYFPKNKESYTQIIKAHSLAVAENNASENSDVLIGEWPTVRCLDKPKRSLQPIQEKLSFE